MAVTSVMLARLSPQGRADITREVVHQLNSTLEVVECVFAARGHLPFINSSGRGADPDTPRAILQRRCSAFRILARIEGHTNLTRG
eukprot:7257582-Pyramimonas_sp.AAC.1